MGPVLMKEYEQYKTKWERDYGKQKGFYTNKHLLNFRFIGNVVLYFAVKLMKKILSNDAKILDAGCGSGRMLLYFKTHGYPNAIGIDYSKNGITVCEELGLIRNKDVFLKDIVKNNFKPKSFDLVYSHGLLEHLYNFQPIVNGMCRLSKKYVLLLQPDQFSKLRFLDDIYRFFLPDTLIEKPYKPKDYSAAFAKSKFVLKEKQKLPLYWLLLYERKTD